MRREIRTALVFAAAALSVVAVPLIAALVVHLDAAVMAAIVSAVGTLAGALVTSVFWIYSRAQNSAARTAAELERSRLEAVVELLATLPSGAVYRDVGERREITMLPLRDISQSELPAQVRILTELAAIEREARVLLGEGSSTSIIRIRSRLQDSGVWSEEDVYDFDAALRTRNKVAHGDQEGLTAASLVGAIEAMERLRRKLEAGQFSPPSN